MRKRYVSAALCLLVLVLLLCSCSAKALPLVLPQDENVVSVRVTQGERETGYTDRQWISAFLSAAAESEPTAKPSVQDVPDVPNPVQIDLLFAQGASMFFLYEEDGSLYQEQPYSGIYQATPELVSLLEPI